MRSQLLSSVFLFTIVWTITNINNTISAQNYSLDFERLNEEYVDLSDIPASATYSIEFWFKLDTVINNNRLLAAHNVNSSAYYSIYVASDLKLRGSGGISASNTVIQKDTWYHLALIRSTATSFDIYLNGVNEVGTRTIPANWGFTDEQVLCGNLTNSSGGSSGVFIEGQIDEFRVWDGPRTAAEVQANMNVELTCNESNLVVYYKFDNDNSPNDIENCIVDNLHGQRMGDTSLPEFSAEQPSPLLDVACTGCVDQGGPTALCKDISITLDYASRYTLDSMEIDNGSTDDCPGLTFELSKYFFDCTDIGAQTVDLIVTDDADNSASCSSVVTVTDSVLDPIMITAIDTLCVVDDVIFEVSGFDVNSTYSLVPLSENESGTRRIDVGDIDDDGDIDIAAASADSDEIALLFNDGTGSFTRTVIHSSADGAVWVEIVDFDQDGDQDVLAASQLDNTIRLLLNDGSEQFTEHIITTMANDVRVAVSIDIENDGDLDIVASLFGDSNLTVYRMDNFSLVGTFDVFAPAVTELDVGDIDGDGLDDLAGNRNTGGTDASWYKNNGSSLTRVDYGPGNLNFRNAVALGDIDDDGDLDVLLSYSSANNYTSYINDGSGNFTSFTTGATRSDDFAIGDINSDGFTDIAHQTGSSLLFKLNDQNGEHSSFRPLTLFDWFSPHIADFDNDGDNEVIYANIGSIITADYNHWGIINYQLDSGPVQQLKLNVASGKFSINLGVLSAGVHTLSISAYGYNEDCLTTTSFVEEFTVSANQEQRWYPDNDGDGFGDADDNGTLTCLFLEGHTLNNTDCNDNDPNNFPGNIEVCDGYDNNCDGIFDEGFNTELITFHDTIALGLGIASSELFGARIEATEDVLAVLAPGSNNNPTADGVYVFTRNDCQDLDWQFVKKIQRTEFNEIAITDDYLFVGLNGLDSLGSNTGAVYIYQRNLGGANNWGFLKSIMASDFSPTLGDNFGSVLSVENNTLFVSGKDARSSGDGAVYVYDKDFGGINNWGEVKILTANNTQEYGFATAADGDFLVVGADEENNLSGAIYLYQRHYGGLNAWGLRKKLRLMACQIKDYLDIF